MNSYAPDAEAQPAKIRVTWRDGPVCGTCFTLSGAAPWFLCEVGTRRQRVSSSVCIVTRLVSVAAVLNCTQTDGG